MSDALLKTKLHVPRLRSTLVPRPRLALDVDNRWALLLFVPVIYLAWNAWEASRKGHAQVRRQARRLALGAGVLLVLTIMFVAGEAAMPLFGPAMLLGGLIALVEWLRRRSTETTREVRA